MRHEIVGLGFYDRLCWGSLWRGYVLRGNDYKGKLKGVLHMDWQKTVEKACDAFADKQYGEIVTHTELADIVFAKPKDQRYRYLMSAVAKRMLETGRMIENVRGVGYRLVEPDKYSTKSVDCVLSAGRKLDKGVKILDNAPVSNMTQNGVQRYNNVRDRMTILQAHVSGAKVEINMLDGKRKHPLAVDGHA